MSSMSDAQARAYYEQRRDRRSAVKLLAKLECCEKMIQPIALLDLSQGGFRAKAINPVKPGTMCRLILPLARDLQAEIRWWSARDREFGCAFRVPLTPQALKSALDRWQLVPPISPAVTPARHAPPAHVPCPHCGR